MFVELPTSRGPILIDEADEGFARQFRWYAVPVTNGRFYAHARVPKTGKRVLMHRMLMSAPKGFVVHHRNNNGLDNRRCNLEITTNRKNTRYAISSKPTGVYFDANAGRWRVAIRASLGTYSDEITARDIAAKLMQALEDKLEELIPSPPSKEGE